jgi:hypothetical protein
MMAGAQPNQPKPVDLTPPTNMVEQQPGAPPLIPSPNWYLIASKPGPNIPAGWQIVNIEAVLQNGNSMTGWLVYMYNPSTRQTWGYLIGIQ